MGIYPGDKILLLSDEAEDLLPREMGNVFVNTLEDEMKMKLLVEAYAKYSLTELEEKLK